LCGENGYIQVLLAGYVICLHVSASPRRITDIYLSYFNKDENMWELAKLASEALERLKGLLPPPSD
jgi:hypothetical protein